VTDKTLHDEGFRPAMLTSGKTWGGMTRIEDVFYEDLRAFVTPKHNWTAIYLIAGIYILVIGPINFLLGKKWRDWRKTTAAYLGAVLGACLLLGYLGQRGRGESAAVNAIAYARPLGGGSWDVTEWASAFVTSGGIYRIECPAASNLYWTGDESESVNGVIHDGPQGTLTVDMPLFSSRTFLVRGKMKGPDLGLAVERWAEGDDAAQLALGTGPEFPKEVLGMWVITGDKFYRLQQNGKELTVGSCEAENLEKYFAMDQNPPFSSMMYNRWGSREEEPAVDPARKMVEMSRPLQAWALGGSGGFRYRFVDGGTPTEPGEEEKGSGRFVLPKDAVQVFILARSPASFGLVNNPFGRESSYVMYHVPLRNPAE
jgi:hypothetical protein